ncbi:MAG: ABC transporter permease subunit/CPBP intramembrane protease, partial [Planctomycetota bacterium]
VDDLAADENAEPPLSIDSNKEDGLRIIGNLARDRSQIANRRLTQIISAWQKSWVSEHLTTAGVNPKVFEPLAVASTDTAPPSAKRAMLWSKILPFVMLIWALTGAFYPAIDLCAGEKERGTLETLLSSPARRREIVWGKLGTICVFSIASALLNLMSMHLTAGIIVKQMAAQGTPALAEALGPMPIQALGWLVLLLLPMAAFFSALALAVAALARSTKEGQYYLMPLLLVTLPLVAVPMMPSLELNLGTSLLPVSGAVFLVRSLIEERYTEALVHLPVVLMVTATCCWFSTRWAIRQFESETVMFRESERWNLRMWVHHLWRDREETASPAEAMLCGVTIIVAMFFAQFLAGSAIDNWAAIVQSTAVVQIGLILTPCLLMAIFLTRSIRRALRIHRPQPSHMAAAALLGICMHPSYTLLGEGIQQVYQIGDETKLVLMHFQNMVMSQPLWAILLVMAAMPAVCEEIAFRGFIFGGLLRQKGVLRAIVISALFFGFTHTVLQQSIAASVMGVVLGFIAWRTGGILCTIVVHFINNALSLTMAWNAANGVAIPSAISWAVTEQDGSWAYESTWITMSIMLTIALMMVLVRRSEATRKFLQAEVA